METGKEGLELIKKYEGFRNNPYKCPAGVWTIGYGFTHYPFGGRVKATDKPITKLDADVMLVQLLKIYEEAVQRQVKVELSQNQFDALVSFTYNLGEDKLITSTLLKKINKNPNDLSIADEFKKWVYSGGVKLSGLKKRRNQEAWLYFN